MKYPDTDGPTERTIRAAQILKGIDPDYFAPVIRSMLAKEKTAAEYSRWVMNTSKAWWRCVIC